MNPTSTRTARLNYDDYCLIPEDGRRHEIIDGEHHVSPAPFFRHQRIIFHLSVRLYEFVGQNKSGTVAFAPVDVLFSDFDIVQPDILFISNDRASIITEKNVQGAPDLLIEILSEGNRRHDEVTKRKLYERFGIPEYWIVDPELETVKVYRLKDKGYGPPLMLSRENADVLETPLLPDFRCGLHEIFVD